MLGIFIQVTILLVQYFIMNQQEMDNESKLKFEYIDEFQLIRQLGSGYQAIVYLAIDRICHYVAIKKFKKMPTTDSGVDQQLRVMEQLHHQNLIKLISVRPKAIYKSKNGETHPCFAFVLQYAQGGELFDFVADTGKFSEKVARTYFHQMMNGIHYMHEKGYAHRDIKPQNLLLSDKFTLKIADFGFTCLLRGRDGKGVLKTKLGTEGYMAPEISLKQYQGRKVDIFAAGIILFIMYAGNPPFQRANDHDPYYKLVMEKEFDLFWENHSRKKKFGYFSSSFKSLFEKMVAFDPAQRPTVLQIAKHPWVKSPICTHSEIIMEFTERKRRLKILLQQRRIKQQEEQNKEQFIISSQIIHSESQN